MEGEAGQDELELQRAIVESLQITSAPFSRPAPFPRNSRPSFTTIFLQRVAPSSSNVCKSVRKASGGECEREWRFAETGKPRSLES